MPRIRCPAGICPPASERTGNSCGRQGRSRSTCNTGVVEPVKGESRQIAISVFFMYYLKHRDNFQSQLIDDRQLKKGGTII